MGRLFSFRTTSIQSQRPLRLCGELAWCAHKKRRGGLSRRGGGEGRVIQNEPCDSLSSNLSDSNSRKARYCQILVTDAGHKVQRECQLEKISREDYRGSHRTS